jgi:hypothetical protein
MPAGADATGFPEKDSECLSGPSTPRCRCTEPSVPGAEELGEPMITDYEVHMVVRRRTAMVFSLPLVSNDRPPRILWAGDLDRDGVTDLIVDAPPHYNARRYILFLSSLARGEQIVAEAASLAFVGC